VSGHVWLQVASPQVTAVQPGSQLHWQLAAPQLAAPQLASVFCGHVQVLAMVSGSWGSVSESRPRTVPRPGIGWTIVSNDSTTSDSTDSDSFFIARLLPGG
jgi:hypothetical protein